MLRRSFAAVFVLALIWTMSFSAHAQSAPQKMVIVDINSASEAARYSDVKGITTTNNDDLKATFSNFGGEAFAAAPGVKMWVAYPNYQLTVVSGTSYSSPLAAAEAALVIDALQRKYSWHSYDNVHYAMRQGTVNINRLNPLYYNKLGKDRIYIPWALAGTANTTNSTTN